MYFLTEGTAVAGSNSSMIFMLVAMFAIMYDSSPEKETEGRAGNA